MAAFTIIEEHRPAVVGRLSGNVVSEVLDSLRQTGTEAFETIFGQKAGREAQATQLALAQAKAEQLAAQTKARAEATRYIAIGGAVLGGALILVGGLAWWSKHGKA